MSVTLLLLLLGFTLGIVSAGWLGWHVGYAHGYTEGETDLRKRVLLWIESGANLEATLGRFLNDIDRYKAKSEADNDGNP